MKLFQAFHNSSFILSFLLFACQIIVVRAQTATLGAAPTQTSGSPNATGTTYEVGWKSTSKRGTSDLLRSCFATIGLALWSSVVLNVQMAYGDTLSHMVQLTFEDTEEEEKKKKLLKFLGFYYFKGLWTRAKAQFRSGQWVRWKHKILWAGLNLVIPELALGVALDEYDTAKRLLDFLQEGRKENTDGSSVISCMKSLWRSLQGKNTDGSSVISSMKRLWRSLQGEKDNIVDVFSTWDMSVAFYAVTGGFYVPEPQPVQKGPEVPGPELAPKEYIPGTKSVRLGLVERCCEVTRMRMEHLKRVRENSTIEFEGPKKPKRVLTAEGVVYIAKLMDKLKGCDAGSYCGESSCTCKAHGEKLQAQFGDISPQILADLSKGSSLARILFMFQASWMIAQSLVRWRSDLSLTLLELQAAAHVGLATVRYFVWYHKPMDIVLMSPLSLTEAQYKTMQDELSSPKPITSHYQFEERFIKKDKSSRDLNGSESNTTAGNQTEEITEIPKEVMTGGQTEQGGGRVADLENQTEEVGRWWLWSINKVRPSHPHYFTSQATLGKSAYQQAGGDRSFLRQPFQTALQGVIAFTLSCDSGRWWLFREYLWGTTCILYNGVNLLAWRWYFPSKFEKIAWRACAVFICGSFIGLTFVGFLAHVYYFSAKHLFNKPPSFLYRGAVRIGSIFFWTLIGPWIGAKVFIFIESLISLRKIPGNIYDVASWATFLPHI